MEAFRLKLGLEVHAQLAANHKLFSRTRPLFNAKPNKHVAYFDAALPGTQPKLSWSCVNLAVRAGLALNSKINSFFSFDRKHYMYPDQPAGYQITQLREPVASGGYLNLNARDFIAQAKRRLAATKRIGIQQIQMEQDTGKTTYVDNLSLVDLNRANTGLIELITDPDFTTADEAVAFIRKLQLLLKRMGVCTGEMESGAMRVDVNVSVADPNGADLGDRCEIKNLFSTSAVRHAIKVEYERQCQVLLSGGKIERETRGWDGKKTWRLRSKENATDYRYMPDPDLPRYSLPANVVEAVRKKLPESPDKTWDRLVSHPYNVKEIDARTLVETEGGAEFCIKATDLFLSRGGSPENARLIGTWLVHRWLGETDKLPDRANEFVDILLAVDSKRVSTTSAKLLVRHFAQGNDGNVDSIITEFGLDGSEESELQRVCVQVIDANPDVVKRVKSGKKNSIGFLLGQVMKETQGTCDPKDVKMELEKLLYA